MKIAFVLFKYFPFGGLQRDFMRIARLCAKSGHDVVVYTLSWQGEQPVEFDIRIIEARALTNHRRYQVFEKKLLEDINKHPVDILVGFNKIANLDVYYAADACYAEKAHKLRGRLYRMGSRYSYFYHNEKAVFSRQSRTEILMISNAQKGIFQKYYHTPDERFHLLPPGIARDRRAPDNAGEIRSQFRKKMNLNERQLLLLMIGSGFKTKGLDRALLALQSLEPSLREKVQFIIIGQDNPKKFTRYAQQLGLGEQVSILAGRDDIPEFLLGADVLIHPAYNENTGTVLLEAMVAGLPVLVTDVCGYAHYIQEADAGIVLPSPFSQSELNQALFKMLKEPHRRAEWQKNGLAFADTADIYSMPESAVELIEQFAQQKSSSKVV